MPSNNSAASRPDAEEVGLDGRYGKIGISAVAAALAYQSDYRNPAATKVDRRDDDRQETAGKAAA